MSSTYTAIPQQKLCSCETSLLVRHGNAPPPLISGSIINARRDIGDGVRRVGLLVRKTTALEVHPPAHAIVPQRLDLVLEKSHLSQHATGFMLHKHAISRSMSPSEACKASLGDYAARAGRHSPRLVFTIPSKTIFFLSCMSNSLKRKRECQCLGTTPRIRYTMLPGSCTRRRSIRHRDRH